MRKHRFSARWASGLMGLWVACHVLAQYGGGPGRGDIAAALPAPTSIASNIFSGSAGRGDIAAAPVVPTPLASPMFSGGTGRGDIAAALPAPTPITSNIFSGSAGRGDIAAVPIVPTPLASIMFSGGVGRGDITVALPVPTPIISNIFSGSAGRGDIAAAPVVPTPLASPMFSGGTGRGDITVALPAPTPITSNIFSGSAGRGDIASAPITTAPIASNIFLGSTGRGDIAFLFTVPHDVLLALKGVLEGPYNSSTGLMIDALRVANLLPLSQPYTSLGYSFTGGGGGETTTSGVLSVAGNDAIVDWVVVELRDNTTPTTVLAARSALLQRDGDVVATDGASPLSFNTDPGTYRIALRHRNHLGAMTLNGVALSTAPVNVDLGAGSTATFGTGGRKVITGTFPAQALWAGDVTFDGQLKYTGSGNDRDPILTIVGGTTPNNSITAYSSRDVNLDGLVKYTGSANDRDPILINVGSTTPNNVRSQQLP